MADNQEPLERIVLTRLMRLNATISGIVVGLLGGLAIFAATVWLVLKGGPPGPEGEPVVGPHLSLLGQFFIGYEVTFAGSLIGFAYGFVTGFVVGFCVARIYNWLVGWREDRSPA
jgi:hypothetical protein